jgi:SAM-dependent methyltransferase
MCNVDCIRWAAKNLTKADIKGKAVIEVGSYDVNGSLRYIVELLEPAEYMGTDIMKGPGVDIICPSENLVEMFGKESFDVVISTCTLEHTKNWKKAISNIKNVCKPNGIILIIVPSVWRFHAYPYDFWRYKKEDIENIFSDCDILILQEDPQPPSLVYVKIRKTHKFKEKDLKDYKLYSIIVNKRVSEIHDEDFQSFYFRRLTFRNKISSIIKKISPIVFSKI